MADSQRGQLGAGSVRGMHQPATTQFVRQPRRNVAEEAQNVAGSVERVGNETAEDLVQRMQAVLERGQSLVRTMNVSPRERVPPLP